MPLAIPLLFFIYGNVNAIELYNKENSVVTFDGNVNASHLISNNVDNDGDFTFFNLGFKSETKFNDDFTGYSRWQYNFPSKAYENTKRNNKANTNLAYVGFKYGNLGSFDYGRNIGLIYKTTSVTKSLQKFNSISNRNEGFLAETSGGVATYHNKNFFGLIEGLNFDLQYKGNNHFTNVNRTSSLDANGEGYAVFASYNFSDLTISGSFSNIKRIDIQNKLRYGYGKKAQSWATSIKYDLKPIYLAASYNENLHATPITDGFANKTKNLEILAQGKFLNGSLRPTISYARSTAHNIETITNDVDLHKYIGIGASYFFNKDISVYAEYKINLLETNSDKKNINIEKLKISKDNVAAVGFNYHF